MRYEQQFLAPIEFDCCVRFGFLDDLAALLLLLLSRRRPAAAAPKCKTAAASAQRLPYSKDVLTRGS